MEAFTVREAAQRDAGALTELWVRTFGDNQALVEDFLRLLPDIGTGAAAEVDGRLAGAAYAVTGFELADLPGAGKAPVCGYLYAVAVSEECRGLGIGSAVTKAAAALARDRGAKILCTLPAESSLYGWYERLLGLRPALRRERRVLPARALDPAMKLSASEYMLWREAMLRGQPHLRPSYPALEFQRLLCEAYGGGLYACGDGIGAVYLEEGRAVIRELVCPAGRPPEEAAAFLAAELGAGEAVLFTPAPPGRGEAYIAATPGGVPCSCHWGIAFD